MVSRILHLVASLLVAACVLGPSAVNAAVLPTDRLGDLPVSEHDPREAGLAPDITAPAGVLVLPDGRVVWARNPDTPRAIASTTKIMTALVVLERASLDEEVIVSSQAARTSGASARIIPGGVYTVRDLLEAMLVRSGNDAANALAEHVAGDVSSFVAMMNEKARQIGLMSAAFESPHGLDAPGHHVSANDMATLARLAMKDDEFRRMVAMDSVTVEGVEGPTVLENSNLLMGTVEGATGVKTGWTGKAGYCLVASAQRGGHELVAVVLGTANEMDRFREAGLLLEWGFAHYRDVRLAETGETMGTVPVSDYLDVSVEAMVEAPVTVPVFDIDGEVTSRVDLLGEVPAPVRAGDRIGTLSLTQGERLIAQAALVAQEEVRRPSPFKRLQIALTRAWRSTFGGPAQIEPQPQ